MNKWFPLTGYNRQPYDWECGTASCIGGWSDALAGQQPGFDSSTFKRMGLTLSEGCTLCYSEGQRAAAKMSPHLRAKGMASVLRDLADTDIDVQTALDKAVEAHR